MLLFIHGGANATGSTSLDVDGVDLYDGAALAEATGAVVVTTNYRLGSLGFLAHSALTEAYGTGSGNLALRDMIAALDWVQANIAEFGGDPARVVVFGESAGAVDTCMLLVSPLAEGRMAGAIMESGGCQAEPLADREAEGVAAVDSLGCGDAKDVVRCLRDLPWQDIAALTAYPAPSGGLPGDSGYGPAVDGTVIPDDPEALLAAGDINDVPFIVGNNSDETSQWTPPLTDAQLRALLDTYLGTAADAAYDLYDPAETGSAWRSWVDITTDAAFTCPARRIARWTAAANDAPVWRYYFTNGYNGAGGNIYGAFHGLELFYVFQQLDAMKDTTGYRPDDEDRIVEAAMGAGWGNLAWDGDPNGTTLSLDATWDEYETDRDDALQIDQDLQMVEGIRTEQCDFWDSWL